MQDPEHEVVSVFKKTWIMFSGAYLSSRLFLPCMGLASAVTILSLVTRRYHAGFVMICAISAVLLIAYYFKERALLNQLMFPLSIVGLYCLIVSRDQISQKLFWGLWIPGFIYGFCINLSSNQYFFAFSSVSTLMSVASIIIACRYIASELKRSGERPAKMRNCIVLAFSMLMVIQLSCELSFRYKKVYWDGGGIRNQTVVAEDGPDKGIFLNSRRHARYLQTLKIVKEKCSAPEVQKVVFLSQDCGLYLLAQKDFASYSAWLYDPEKLNTYYDLFPDKKPDLIFAIGEFYLQFLSDYLEKDYVFVFSDHEAEIAVLACNNDK